MAVYTRACNAWGGARTSVGVCVKIDTKMKKTGMPYVHACTVTSTYFIVIFFRSRMVDHMRTVPLLWISASITKATEILSVTGDIDLHLLMCGTTHTSE